jgi:hypothetical protein
LFADWKEHDILVVILEVPSVHNGSQSITECGVVEVLSGVIQLDEVWIASGILGKQSLKPGRRECCSVDYMAIIDVIQQARWHQLDRSLHCWVRWNAAVKKSIPTFSQKNQIIVGNLPTLPLPIPEVSQSGGRS